ncbi:MAG: hypothetical protein J6U07_05905 [Fibrobacter sp.]|nr:hypothetical protein [Fibrobacter sp.]
MQEKAADKQKRNDEEERGPLVVKTGIRRARVESVDGDFAETLVQVFGPACLAGDDGAGGYAYFWSATESTEEPGFLGCSVCGACTIWLMMLL